jgi:hypothetical protein
MDILTCSPENPGRAKTFEVSLGKVEAGLSECFQAHIREEGRGVTL